MLKKCFVISYVNNYFFSDSISSLFLFVLALANSFFLAISLFLLGFVCNKQKYEMITIKQLIEDILTKFLETDYIYFK
jgi:hypothetical protein